MTIKEKTLSVSAIKEGTVIDHIAAGQGLTILRLLPLNEARITIGLNLKSASMGLKDLIKIENVFLSPEETGHIALFSPSATVNVIQDYQVAQKFSVSLPEKISDVLRCPHPRCISRSEVLSSLFTIEESHLGVLLRCSYCEKLFSENDFK